MAKYADDNRVVEPLVECVNSSIIGKLEFLLNNPIDAVLLLPRTFINNATDGSRDYFHTMVDAIGFNTVRTPTAIVVILYTLFILAAIYARGKLDSPPRKCVFVVSAFIASLFSMLAVFGILYVTWTVAGDTVVEGVQGRYFLPSFIFASLVMVTSFKLTLHATQGRILKILVTGLTVSLLLTVGIYLKKTYIP